MENCYQDFYKPSVCRTCKIISGYPPKFCSQCRAVSYCCKHHQKEDWKSHKTICKIIANEHEYLESNITNYKELVDYKNQRGSLWTYMLGRDLGKVEMQMFMFTRVCAVCFRMEPLKDCHCNVCTEKTSLFPCSNCLSEFYCCVAHKEQHESFHKKFCEELKLALLMDIYIQHNFTFFCDFIATDIDEKFESMPLKSEEFIELITTTHLKLTNFAYINNCNKILSGLNILFALEVTGLISKRFLQNKTSLDIHLVGSDEFECLLDWGLIIEIFAHWIKNLEEVRISFVGPNAQDIIMPLKDHKFCQKCKTNKTIIKNVYKTFYHCIENKLDKPDIVVCFNSGIHVINHVKTTWHKSLNRLVKYPDVPLLLTAYSNKEIKEDVERVIKKANAKVFYGGCRNPYSDLTPMQDWDNEDYPVFYSNGYMAILKKDS